MEFSVSIPLDSDGFLRRECPHCQREFKWFDGQTEGTPDDWQSPDQHFCPYCGEPSDADDFMTQAQSAYVTSYAGQHAAEFVQGELENMLRGFNSGSSFLKMSVEMKEAPLPSPLSEPDDMDAIEPPCHSFEPLKVLDASAGPFFCLVCRSAFEIAD